MYIVVLRNICKEGSFGVTTQTLFRSKEHFDVWYDDKMRVWYQVVEEGVTQERATELCSSSEATLAALSDILRGGVRHLRAISERHEQSA